MGGAKLAGGTVLRASDAAPKPVGASSAQRSIPYFSVDDWIADTYEVKRIVEGGMGTVYVCYHDRWKVDLVVKVPKEDVLSDPEHAHRIEVEAEARGRSWGSIPTLPTATTSTRSMGCLWWWSSTWMGQSSGVDCQRAVCGSQSGTRSGDPVLSWAGACAQSGTDPP